MITNELDPALAEKEVRKPSVLVANHSIEQMYESGRLDRNKNLTRKSGFLSPVFVSDAPTIKRNRYPGRKLEKIAEPVPNNLIK